MNLYSLIFVTCILCVNGISMIPGFRNYFTLYGQVIYPTGSQISIEPGSRIMIDLQDISVTDELVTTIAEYNSEAIVFPIIFNISYTWNQIIEGHVYILNAKIINEHNDILFVNEKRIEVKLLGAGRTRFVDIPVVPLTLHDLIPMAKLPEWPELVGEDGDVAVDIIKKETGYKHVFVVTDATKVTKDFRYDRVCVYVDSENKVMHVPRPG